MFIITAPLVCSPFWCQRSTPTVAAENSVRVLLWHSMRLASESRSKPHPHHSRSGPPQPIPAAVLEHSAIQQILSWDFLVSDAQSQLIRGHLLQLQARHQLL